MGSGDNMKGQGGQVGTIIISLVILALLIYGSGQYLGALNSSYGLDNSSLAGPLEASDKIYENAQNIQNKTQSMKENPDVITAATGLLDVTSAIWSTINFVEELAVSLVEMTGLSIGWVIPYLLVLMTVVVAFSIANWIRGGGSKL